MAKNGTPSQRFRDELWKILILIKFDERNRKTIKYLEMILLKHFKFIKFIPIYSHQVDTTCISHQFSWILIKKEKIRTKIFLTLGWNIQLWKNGFEIDFLLKFW